MGYVLDNELSQCASWTCPDRTEEPLTKSFPLLSCFIYLFFWKYRACFGKGKSGGKGDGLGWGGFFLIQLGGFLDL